MDEEEEGRRERESRTYMANEQTEEDGSSL